MTALEWYPKMYGAGDIDGAGLRKLLGASHHDPLALLVRETIQNSWDASLAHDGTMMDPHGPPSWTFELRDLTIDETNRLRDAFGAIAPPGTRLGVALGSDPVRVIEISDRGTSGLGGPVRPDLDPHGLTTDFIDLVFNIGAPQDTDGGGGTYGFGKIAAFGVSSCSTVLYRTQPLVGTTSDSPGEHRLIGSTIGENFSLDGNRYTGRHWWGRTVDGNPSPLLGREAEALGDELFTHPFKPGQTGTSLLIVQPDLFDRTPEQTIEHVIDSVLWNAWPKLVPHDDGPPPMHLHVRHQGREIPVPDPAHTQPFSGFVDALQNVRARAADREAPEIVGPWTLHMREDTFESLRPIQLVGHVAVATTMATAATPGVDDEDDVTSARHFDGPAHHLALLREPELVVRYLEGPPMRTPGAQWCGVFKPVRELDHVFAEAEPPSHDDWLDGRVTDRHHKTFVRRGRTKGPNDLFADLRPRQEERSTDSPVQHLAAIADSLGHMVVTGERPTAKRGPGRPRKPRPKLLSVGDSDPITLPDGSTGLRVDFTTTRPTRVEVQVAVALAGGGTDHSDDLIDRMPDVVGVTDGTVPALSDGPRPDWAQHLESGDWVAWVRNRGGVALAVDISAREGDE